MTGPATSFLFRLILVFVILFAYAVVATSRPALNPATPASAFGATPNRPAGDAKARRGPGRTGAPLMGDSALRHANQRGATFSDDPSNLPAPSASAGVDGLQPAAASQSAPAPSVRWLTAPVDVSMGHRAEVSAPAPTQALETAVFQASATWCAPTPTMCGNWGGDAKLAALPGFRGEPYTVRVIYGERSVLVSVVSTCGCGIDLSPAAFRELADLSVGRIDVLVEGPITLPPTSTK